MRLSMLLVSLLGLGCEQPATGPDGSDPAASGTEGALSGEPSRVVVPMPADWRRVVIDDGDVSLPPVAVADLEGLGVLPVVDAAWALEASVEQAVIVPVGPPVEAGDVLGVQACHGASSEVRFGPAGQVEAVAPASLPLDPARLEVCASLSAPVALELRWSALHLDLALGVDCEGEPDGTSTDASNDASTGGWTGTWGGVVDCEDDCADVAVRRLQWEVLHDGTTLHIRDGSPAGLKGVACGERAWVVGAVWGEATATDGGALEVALSYRAPGGLACGGTCSGQLRRAAR